MNEKKFLEKLNSDSDNPDGYCSFNIVSQLIQSKRDSLIPYENSILRRFFDRFNSFKSLEDIIKGNLEIILAKTHKDYKEVLLRILIEDSSLSHIIKEKFSVVLEALQDINNVSRVKIANLLKKIEGFKEFIEENLEEILNTTKDANLLDVVQLIKSVSNDVDCKLEVVLENKQVEIARAILDKATKLRVTDFPNKHECLDDYATTLSIMIREVLASERKGWIDINYMSHGAESDVYQIGEKVIKVGGPRQVYNIPNHRRILQPLIRTNFTDTTDNKVFACLEISDKVETKKDTTYEYTSEELDKLYQIYREIRESGIIWTDARFGNIGILKKKNIPSLNSEDMWVAPNSVGFDKEITEKTLEKGEWVIIDLSYIYLQDDPNIEWSSNSFSRRFEEKWQMEQQTKIARDYKEKSVNDNQTSKPIEEPNKYIGLK